MNSLTDEAQVSVAQVASLQHDCTERVLQVTQFAAALDTEKLQHQAKIELVLIIHFILYQSVSHETMFIRLYNYIYPGSHFATTA